ncbi:MAG TPA: Cys-tRNA(Pro) deacylase [Acidimicrobiia bacterium]
MATRTTRATDTLDRAGVTYTIHEYTVTEKVGEGYGEAVAAAIGLPAGRVFKTLMAEVAGSPVVAVVPVTTRLSTRMLARATGNKRADMMSPADAERATGYVTGGISPFGQKRALDMYLDSSALSHPTIAVSGGVRGLQLEVEPGDLMRVTGATVAVLVEDPADR